MPAVNEKCDGVTLQWMDYRKVTALQMEDIKKVYEHVFEHDIGLVFDSTLDADFIDPCAYYTDEVRGAFIVAVDNKTQQVVGTVALRSISIENRENFPFVGETCELKRMFLLPPYRGFGLARQMMTMMIDKATSFTYNTIVLDTKARLAAANKIYEKFGFSDCASYNGNPRADRFFYKVIIDNKVA